MIVLKGSGVDGRFIFSQEGEIRVCYNRVKEDTLFGSLKAVMHQDHLMGAVRDKIKH